MNEPVRASHGYGPGGKRNGPLAAIVPIEPPVRAQLPWATDNTMVSPALAPQWYSTTPPVKTYVVPKRFGLLSILALTTLMAIVFGVLRFYEAAPVWFLFLGSLSLTICIVQMFYGNVPRLASAFAGALLSPAFVIGEGIFQGHAPLVVAAGALASVLGGGFVGYLMGTCAAGIFLLIEKLEPYLPGRKSPYRGHPLEL